MAYDQRLGWHVTNAIYVFPMCSMSYVVPRSEGSLNHIGHSAHRRHIVAFTHFNTTPHSYRRHLTGFMPAVFIVWKLTVTTASNNVMRSGAINSHHATSIREA